MDKIILLILFSIIGSVTKGNAQLHCFVCNNCPDANQLGSDMVQNCETDPGITTSDPEDTTIPTIPTESTETTETTPPVVTQTTPEEPPTTTPQIPTTDDTTITNDGGITTPTIPIIPPTTTPQVPTSPPVLLGHKYRHIMQELVGDYMCFVVHQQVGNAIQVNRGCVATQETEQQTCFNANSGQDPEDCRLCAYDRCNIASRYVVSLAVVLSSFFVVLAFR